MKRIFSLLMVFLICFSAVGVNASSVPEFMTNVYNNYTADYELSMRIDNPGEIVDFLKELEIPAELENFIDIKSLIETMCNFSTSMNVQASISDDFRKMKAALVMEANQNIVFNKNCDVTFHTQNGIWVDMDIDSKKLILIYSTPLNNKYAVIDLVKDVPKEFSNAIFESYDKVFNREFMEKTNKDIIEIAMKYADISNKGKTYTVNYDNDAFVALINEVIDYYEKNLSDIMLPSGEETVTMTEIPELKGIRILGDEGITCKYTLSGSNIKNVYEKIDISISIADIYTSISGEAWNYVSEGNIDMTLQTKADVSKIGSTKPLMPLLTEDNSFSISELFANGYNEYGYEEEWEMPDVNPYVWGDLHCDTFDGERYYMPLRNCIESAYNKATDITYDNGHVIVTTHCDIPEENINVSLDVGTDFAYVNGALYSDLGTFKLIDGTVYASVDFYEKCLGWTLEYLQKDILVGTLYYEFYTMEYDEC